MDNIFENNLVALARVNLKLSEDLVNLPMEKKYKVFIGNDSADINIIDIENDFEPLYPSNSIEENIQLLKDMGEKSNYRFLYFYGIGNGVFYKMLIKNFQNLEQIIVFEPELELLKIVFSLIDFSQEIEKEKISFYNSNTFSLENAIYIHNKRDDILFYAKLYDLKPLLPYYENNYQENILSLNKLIVEALEHMIFTMGNCVEDSLMGLEHHIANLPKMVKTPTLDELVEKASNTKTAVIVSTGPSLSKQLDKLKEIQDYVTIFCIDASFSILASHGIVPDMVFSLERIALTSEFYKKTPEKFHKDPIFCITSIAHEELLNSIKSDNLQLSTRAFHYLDYFNTRNWGPLGFGMSSANMAFELIMMCKFDNLVFIGQDLAFGEDGNTHANGTIVGTSSIDAYKSKNIFDVEAYGGEGKKVKTNYIWNIFRRYFEQDIVIASKNIDIYNCTEGGARIQGAQEISFKECIDKKLDKDSKKQKIVLEKPSKEFTKENTNNYLTKIKDMKEYILKVKIETEKVFISLMEILENIEEKNKENNLEKIDFDKVDKLIKDIDRVKGHFRDKEFYSVIYDFLKSSIMAQELEIAKIQVKKTNGEEEFRAHSIEWLYAHKHWLFSLAGGMEAILIVLDRGMLKWEN